jgi:ParB family chromosome partitioning protein
MTDQTSQPQSGKRNLGRGLAALFGEENADFKELEHSGAPRSLPVTKLRPGPVQPRHKFDEEQLQSLVDSVREKGVLQPLLVRHLANDPENFEIIAGERRWRAAQMAKIHEIPVVVLKINDAEALEVALVENIQRQDLTPLEEAEGYKRLMDEFSHTQDVLARGVGKSRSHVANMLRLLNLPDQIKEMIDDGRLSAGHGRALLGAEDAAALAQEVIRRGLNVRQTESLAAKAKAGPGTGQGGRKSIRPTQPKDADTLAVERDLSMRLGLKVTISLKGEAGDIAVHFDTLEQLDDVLDRLKQTPAPGTQN